MRDMVWLHNPPSWTRHIHPSSHQEPSKSGREETLCVPWPDKTNDMRRGGVGPSFNVDVRSPLRMRAASVARDSQEVYSRGDYNGCSTHSDHSVLWPPSTPRSVGTGTISHHRVGRGGWT